METSEIELGIASLNTIKKLKVADPGMYDFIQGDVLSNLIREKLRAAGVFLKEYEEGTSWELRVITEPILKTKTIERIIKVMNHLKKVAAESPNLFMYIRGHATLIDMRKGLHEAGVILTETEQGTTWELAEP